MPSNLFRVKNGLQLTPVDLATLTSPQAGDLACDINDNNKIKRYDANAAAWTEVGSGGVGGVDIFFVQDFESASLNTFTQTGLSLTQTDPLKGKVSALLTHQAGTSPTNDQLFKQIIPVDRKFRGIPMVLRLDSKSSASQGNVTINIKDETNNANIVASEQLQLSNDTAGKKTSIAFTIPATCASLSYTITALPQSGSPTTRIDDIICEIAETALLETAVVVPNVTAWQGYTPTFQGFGSPTNVEFEWRQVGESVEIRGKFVSGTPTAVEARVGLPAGLTSAGTGLIPSLQIVGKGANNSTSASDFSGINVLIEPSVYYMTLADESSTNNGLTKVNGSTLAINGTILSFFASVPCAGLSATTTKSIPLTQSGLIQEADSAIRLSGANGFGSTATTTRRFSLANLISRGDAISINDSSTLGTQFIAQKAGIYNISSSEISTASSTAMYVGLRINGTEVAVDNEAINTAAAVGKSASASVSVYLNIGDIVTVTVNAQSESNGAACYFAMSYQGSLKQVSVSSNQKLTIPTSELRFEGASARGTGTESTIVQFTSLAKLRGDAFEINNSNGTAITMKKAGRLSISSAIYQASSGYIVISRNQSNRTTGPTATETLIASGSGATGAGTRPATWVGDVSIGDIIRVYSSVVPSAANDNNLNLSFQEQDISVSVSNTLPQFSESDSSVRVDTANGYGSTATKIRRFSNVRENVGSDINYVDSATEGSSFIARTSGIYEISYTENTSGAVSYFAISKNSSQLTTNPDGISEADRLALGIVSTAGYPVTISSQVYLVAGDVIRAHASGQAAGTNNFVAFRISKVGKPNVTGVDVTPFVNLPQPESQSSFASSGTSLAGSGTKSTLSPSITKGSGIYSFNSTTGIYTVLKSAKFNLSFSLRAVAASNVSPEIAIGSISTVISRDTSVATSGYWANAQTTVNINAGDTFSFSNSGAGSADFQTISILAEALSDQILTAPETFSTDTASLSYASSAAYTLSTLQNAPVGTYITFTYAANTNTRTQTTTRPTQTDADMNANGILLYTRAYNAASTSGNPSAIAIQIGKGLKGINLGLYKSAGKLISGELDHYVQTNSVQVGPFLKSYNELTGILFFDVGQCDTASITTNTLFFSDGNNQNSGYLVINASKNPALTGFGLNRIACVYKTAPSTALTFTGTLGNGSFATWTWNTLEVDTHGAYNTSTGTFTAPSSGTYMIGFNVYVTGSYASFGQMDNYINVNGISVHYEVNYLNAGSGSVQTFGCRPVGIRLNKGDTVTLSSRPNSWSSISVGSSNPTPHRLTIFKVG